ncbi:hypothetical protein [Nannocystis sp. SCPEA4]|uniref:hypothetical protein n=1 Tax=Nannocystis sp. SCPEA4 TaxID=2996787 RepID=UPI00226D7208|nr:hypothetical protein [Nannocystis sp. SCPEA4]MCY1058820.1 hypothetical protein [Nannocystis sp. SCPEA4]
MRALAGSDGIAPEPYRSFVETALEQALREGVPAWTERGPRDEIWGATRVAALFTVLFPAGAVGMAFAPQLVVLLLVGNVIAMVHHASEREVAEVRWLRRRIARYPLPVGALAAWVKRGTLWLGRVELVLRQRSEHVEAAVQLVEPDARMSWSGPTRLRVEVPWSHHGRDHLRFDRLIQFLATHRAELKLERVVLLPPEAAVPRDMDGAAPRRPATGPGELRSPTLPVGPW